jgi:hypothetical protein
MKASFLGTNYLVAVRDSTLDVVSGSAAVGQAAPVTFQIRFGVLSYNENDGATDAQTLDTSATHANKSSYVLTLTNIGGVERLTMQISASDTEDVSPLTVDITFNAQLVSTRGRSGDYNGDAVNNTADYKEEMDVRLTETRPSRMMGIGEYIAERTTRDRHSRFYVGERGLHVVHWKD